MDAGITAPGVVEKLSQGPERDEFLARILFLRGGIDSVYVAADVPIGMQRFAPRIPAHGSMSSARMRAHPGEESDQGKQNELYPQR